jgi:type III secretory pathway component EscT
MACYTRSRRRGIGKEGANECLFLPYFIYVVFVKEGANGKVVPSVL